MDYVILSKINLVRKITALLIFIQSISAFEAQRQQQAMPQDAGGAAAIVQPKRRQELQIPYNNNQTSPIGVLNNREFCASVMPFFKINDSNPVALYNSLNELLSHISISKNFTSIIRQFVKEIKGKFNIEATDILGQTALHFAAAYKNLNVAKLLIALGADVNAITYLRIPDSGNLSEEAIMRFLPTIDKFIGNTNINSLIRQLPESLSKIFFELVSFTPMHFAILNNDINMINLFVKSGFMSTEDSAFLSIYLSFENQLNQIPYSFEILIEENFAIMELFLNYRFKNKLSLVASGGGVIDILTMQFFVNTNLFSLLYNQEYLDRYRKELLEKEG